jgi:hypothetical protein
MIRRPHRAIALLAIVAGLSAAVPAPAAAEIVSASCFVAYRVADGSITDMYGPLQLGDARLVSADVGPPFAPAAMKASCLRLFKDSALADCAAGPGVDSGFVSAQVGLTTIDDVGAKAKTLIDDVKIQRKGVKINWRSCATLER